jgi:hypothetical protein
MPKQYDNPQSMVGTYTVDHEKDNVENSKYINSKDEKCWEKNNDSIELFSEMDKPPTL